MLKDTNTTTFDEVHGMIYNSVEEDNAIGGIEDQPKKGPYKPCGTIPVESLVQGQRQRQR
eukprot:1199456-Amphidinium_carterae.1